MAAIYKKSEEEKIVYVRRAIATTTVVEAYGSGDEYAVPYDLFGDDEYIKIMGSVTATDLADLSLGTLRLTVNAEPPVIVPLTFDAVSGSNMFEHSLGVLSEADYTVTATFLRLRKAARPAEGAEIVYVDEYEPSSASITFGASADPIYTKSTRKERFSIRAIAMEEIPGCPFENLKRFPNIYNFLCRIWQRMQEFRGQ